MQFVGKKWNPLRLLTPAATAGAMLLGGQAKTHAVVNQEPPAQRKTDTPVSYETRQEVTRLVRELEESHDTKECPVAPRQLGKLIEALGHPEFEQREKASQQLLAIGSVARPAIRKAAKDPDRERAVRAEGILRKLDLRFPRQIEILRRFAGLGNAASEAVPLLHRMLKGGDKPEFTREQNIQRTTALVKALGYIGLPAAETVPCLVEMLATEDDGVRVAVIRTLGSIRSDTKNVAPQLILQAGHPNPDVRSAAVEALAELRPDPRMAQPVLVRLLRDKDATVRLRAITALHRLAPKDKSLLPGLVATLKDKDNAWFVRHAALEALQEFGPQARDAVPDLLAVLDTAPAPDYHPLLAEAAVLTLQKIGPGEPGVLPGLIAALDSSDPDIQTNAVNALGTFGEAAEAGVPKLARMLKDNDHFTHADLTVRSCVTAALGRIGPDAKGVLPALAEAMQSPQVPSYEKSMIAFTLADFGAKAKSALPALIEGLKSDDWQLRETIIEALGRIGPDVKGVVPTLIATLQDRHDGVRLMAVQELGAFGPKAASAVPALTAVLKDTSPHTRKAVIQTLGAVGAEAEGAVQALTSAVQDKEHGVRYAAVEELGKLGLQSGKAVSGLIVALKHQDQRIQIAALQKLEEIGPNAQEALPVVREMAKKQAGETWQQKQLREQAADTLAAVEPKARGR